MARDAGILYADISGSTRLYRTLGTDEAKHQLERCVKRMERSIDSCKGTLVMPAIDEMVAIFPTADDAVLAALDMQKRIADLPPVSGVRLSIRIGVHFGSLEEAPEGLRGSAVEIGRSLLSLAGSGQVVTCEQTSGSVSKQVRAMLLPIADMTLSTPLGDCQVFEVKEGPGQARTSSTATTTFTSSAISAQHVSERLFVRVGGTAYVIDNAAPRMTFGRDRDSSFVLHGPKVSRHHAVIEKRGRAGFVLVDQSTNGTYVSLEGVGEQRLQNAEAVLTGRGKIAFGHSTTTEGEVIEIEFG